MLRRTLRRARRYPVAATTSIAMPIVFLLLFVYVFGDMMGAGLAAGSSAGASAATGGRGAYLDYVIPGILMMSVAGAATSTAIVVAMDTTTGIVNRFRTMPVAPGAVLTGHVIGGLLQVLVAMVVVTGVALLLGFSPTATAVEWLAAAGILALASLSLIWLSVALGLVTDSVETASNLPMPLILLPFLGSGVVPVESLPGALQWFAEHQPFTPIMETVRGLLLGTAIGSQGLVAVAWCVAITVGGWAWARHLFAREATE